MSRYLKKSIIILISVSFFSTLVYADTNKLTGAWQCNDNYGNRSSLKFLSKNLLEYDSDQMNYRATPKAIKIQNDYGIEEDYPYTFKKKSLTIIFPDMTQIVCSKIVQSAKKAKTSSSHTGGSFIIGPLCSWSGSSSSYSGSSYSSSKRIYFSQGNHFSLSSESSFSSSAGNYYDQGGNPQSSGTYTIEGNSVIFRFANGSSTRMSINIRQNSGEITELMFGQKLFAKSLCN